MHVFHPHQSKPYNFAPPDDRHHYETADKVQPALDDNNLYSAPGSIANDTSAEVSASTLYSPQDEPTMPITEMESNVPSKPPSYIDPSIANDGHQYVSKKRVCDLISPDPDLLEMPPPSNPYRVAGMYRDYHPSAPGTATKRSHPMDGTLNSISSTPSTFLASLRQGHTKAQSLTKATPFSSVAPPIRQGSVAPSTHQGSMAPSSCGSVAPSSCGSVAPSSCGSGAPASQHVSIAPSSHQGSIPPSQLPISTNSQCSAPNTYTSSRSFHKQSTVPQSTRSLSPRTFLVNKPNPPTAKSTDSSRISVSHTQPWKPTPALCDPADDSDNRAIGSTILLDRGHVTKASPSVRALKQSSPHRPLRYHVPTVIALLVTTVVTRRQTGKHTSVESLQSDIHKIRKEQSKLSQEQSTRIAKLEDLVEDLIKRLEAVEVKDPSSTALTAGNISTLNCAICQILFKMMGTASSDNLPQPVNDPTKYWIKLDDDGNETESGNDVLRPKFQDSWTANAKWHRSFFQHFHRDTSAYEDSLAQDAVDRITDKQLKSAAGKVFKNMKERFKEENRPIGIQALNVQIGRREKRQIEKAKLAITARPVFPELDNPAFDFVFATKWQSTDYSGSDVEEEDGSNTSDDDHQSQLPLCHQAFKKKKKSLVFTTHPPGWRSK
ncbi:hypothetical protein BDN67DRAFT_1017302 [Paxillus ammoniavirescens]|nr:hypothetical protein BDN67DRAFT_1017302 [Paxillus ammoniavirescens]